VTLKSSNGAAASTVASVTVPQGATTAQFNITTKPVAVQTDVTFTATVGTTSFTSILTIDPVILSKLAISPSVTYGGTAKPTATLTLTAAPVTDVKVNVTSNATTPAPNFTITVPAGSATGTALVTTRPVASDTLVTLTATYGSSTKSTTFTIRPPTLLTYVRNVASVIGGSNQVLTGTINLSGPAPSGGKVVSLASNNAAITVPATVTVPTSATSFIVTLHHTRVNAPTTVTLTATIGAVVRSFTVTVNPYLRAVLFSPTTVPGGLTSKGYVTLMAAAPTGGLVINLTSSNPAVTVPASVTIPAGTNNILFTATTTAVAADTAATVTATLGTDTKSGVLTVKPPVLASAAVSPTSVKGGSATVVSFTVTLGSVAPAGGTTVNLSSSNTAAATVPASVVVPAGSKTATVTVTHKVVATTTTTTLTASLAGVNKTATLTVAH
jgi:hypothetical protein